MPDDPVLASIDRRLCRMERHLCLVERRSLIRMRQNYGIYATLTLVVATLIISGLQRRGYASNELLNLMYVADAAVCMSVWLTVFLRPWHLRVHRAPEPAPSGAGNDR